MFSLFLGIIYGISDLDWFYLSTKPFPEVIRVCSTGLLLFSSNNRFKRGLEGQTSYNLEAEKPCL